MGNLDGKVAIVSGSGRGIGQAIALKLASEGASVVVNDLDGEPAKETVAAIESAGGNATSVVGSVTDPDFAQSFVAAATEKFRIHRKRNEDVHLVRRTLRRHHFGSDREIGRQHSGDSELISIQSSALPDNFPIRVE